MVFRPCTRWAPLIPIFAIEPDVPRDPLAAAESAAWALARRLVVLGLPVDDRSEGLLRSLQSLDELLELLDQGGGGHTLGEAELAEATAVDDAAIELSPDEISDADQPDAAEAFVQASTRDRVHMASAETVVLSGPDIRRKIRHKQSIMPSYVSQVLYEDIGALFEIGDREGALVSLERLLTVAPVSPQIESFLSHNETRLLEYYESVLGPWTRVAHLKDPESSMPPAYFRFEKMAAIVELLDGVRPLSAVIQGSGLRMIEACAVLSQLSRSASLDLGEKP